MKEKEYMMKYHLYPIQYKCIKDLKYHENYVKFILI